MGRRKGRTQLGIGIKFEWRGVCETH